MAMPSDVGIIDLMLMIPSDEQDHWYDYMKPMFLDRESREMFKMPAQYMFNVPDLKDISNGLQYTLAQMDKYGIASVGVPGPRLPMEPQKVEHLDEVCWFFPELKVVMRHGGEPWTELAWKLMLKYPNLNYMTSAFAPKYYPEDIIRFANTRGADQVMYAGYFPMGISLERIFKDMPGVPLKDEVWPKFLRDNAMRVFKLDQ